MNFLAEKPVVHTWDASISRGRKYFPKQSSSILDPIFLMNLSLPTESVLINAVISIGWLTRKPNSIPFQSYMLECARSLGQELEYPTDALLLPLIQLQNMAEVNHHRLSTVGNTIRDHMDGLDLEMKVQSFQAEFKQWEHSLPLVWQQPSKLT